MTGQFKNIKRAIIGTFGYVFEYWKTLGKALLIPFLLLLAIDLYEYEMESPNVGLVILLTIISVFLNAIFAITTHRVVLLGPDSVPTWGLYKLTGREIKFVLYIIGLGLLMIPAGLLSIIPLVGFVLMILLIAYLAGRLSLVFPAIATDYPMTFGESWQATENHQLFMVAIVVVFPIAIAVPEALLGYVPYGGILISVISLLTTVFVVSALSMAFKIIKEQESIKN